MIRQFNDNSYRYLSDNTNNLTCYCLPVNAYTDSYARWLREHFIGKSQQMGYRGYDTDYDDSYHSRSAYFYIKKRQEGSLDVLLIMRLTGADASLIFPFESGVDVNGESYSLGNRDDTVDMNTFYSSGINLRAGFQLLMASIGLYAKALGSNRCLGLVDVNQEKIERFYINHGGLWPSVEFSNPVRFDGYTFNKTLEHERKNVDWRVLEWGSEEINVYARNAKDYELEPNNKNKGLRI